jgi:hypothetical protein
LFVACFRHEEAEYPECGRRNRRQEEEACVGTKVMHDGTGDDLNECSANAYRSIASVVFIFILFSLSCFYLLNHPQPGPSPDGNFPEWV